MRLEPGQIVLFDGHDRHWSGRTIHKVQLKRGYPEEAARWIHVAGVGTDGLLVDPQPLRIRKTPIEEYIENGYDIAVFTPKWETPETAQARAEAFDSMLGRFYGALDLVWFILPAWMRRKVSIDMPGEFCSEMVCEALEMCGELDRLTDKNPDEVFPAEFAILKKLFFCESFI